MKRLASVFTSLPRTSQLGFALIALLSLAAVFAPLLAPYDPDERVTRPFATPSWQHPLGADDVGHDLLSVLIYGAQPSLLVGFIAAVAATVIGMAVGLSAGYLRGTVDTVLMRMVDVVLALPVLPLTLVIGVLAGPGITTQIFVISIALWAPMARELRAQVLSVRERDHIHALRSMGAKNSYVLLRHVIPSVSVLVIPQLVLAVKSAVLLEASLSFLGLGDVTSMSWGMMLSIANERSAFLTGAWLWWVLPPGALIALTVLAFALAGGAVERAHKVYAVAAPGAPPEPVAASIPAHAPQDGHPEALLSVQGVSVGYGRPGEETGGCRAVSFELLPGQALGLVGESGSGKSTVAAAVIGLMPPAARVAAGQIRFAGQDLLACSALEHRKLLGRKIALIPQEAQSSLNPVYRVGAQLTEALQLAGTQPDAARRRAQELFTLVGLEPHKLRSFPHELSGGQRQRVVIAIALANNPQLLIADEPTSGLDVLIQQEILELLGELRAKLGLSLLIVSHDLPVVAQLADQMAVMQGGQLIEQGPVTRMLHNPQHPYTRKLLAAMPDLREFEGAVK